MEKISSILPSNPRIKSVDLKNSNPVRPGVPTFGQRVGVNTNKDRLTIGDSDLEAVRQQETLAGYNPKEARHAQIASDVTRNFFENRLKEKPVTKTESMVRDTPVSAATELSKEGQEVMDSLADANAETSDSGNESARSLDLYA